MTASVPVTAYNTANQYDVTTEHVEYRQIEGSGLLSTVYKPNGDGPFPLLIDIHGGGWANYERLRDAPIDSELASHGIVVAALDFRLRGHSPHPAAMQDINYGIRWFKAHADDFGADAQNVGGIGYSSGGHQVLMTGMRPNYPTYVTESATDLAEFDARLSYVISCGCIFDVVKSMISDSRGDFDRYDTYNYFGGVTGVRAESPMHIITREEFLELPPLLAIQAGEDDLPGGQPGDAAQFVTAYAVRGGFAELGIFPRAPHIFLNSGLAARSEAMRRGLAMIKGFISRQLESAAEPAAV
jgi:acetyl esterase